MPDLYESLNSPTSIRVFSILPEESTESLRCQLRTVELQDIAGKYIALSYCWGDKIDKEQLLVGSFFVWVPTNLVLFLKQLQSSSSPLSTSPDTEFWADAICINQHDESEKGSQVMEMKNIFGRALAVCAWLGAADDNSNLAVDHVDAVNHHFSEQVDAHGETAAFQTMSAFRFELSHEDELLPWGALLSLMNRPWWERAWIMQEATTDVKTFLICGTRWTTITALVIALGYASRVYLYLDELLSTQIGIQGYTHKSIWLDINRLIEFQPVRGAITASATPSTFLSALHYFRRTQATDPRDKVFAPLNLFDQHRLKPFEIDYHLSSKQIYTALACRCIFGTDPSTLDILGHCIFPPNIPSKYQHGDTKCDLDLPTWVPNWIVSTYQTPFIKSLSRLGAAMATAAYHADCQLWSLESDADDPHPRVVDSRLIVQGLQVDEIANIYRTAHQYDYHPVANSWAPADRDETYPPTGESRYSAYRRVLIADIVHGDENSYRRSGDASLETIDTAANRMETDIDNYWNHRLEQTVMERSMAESASGLIGLVPGSAKEGDHIYALWGGKVLYVLREDAGAYLFIGECYMHGVMDGESVALVRAQGRDPRLEELAIK
ncbi:hypothetical protein K432DRAFT_387383 [Lepidopterella palustris CBS 459.81]|uniref:Heterokaryon incompatibility domain-containing protein n=1 Tax=Lepidopterella palustris CBS 459.81 TaxID=1314670 RepID=A0A8E2DXJ6_9PEZI|nr:hypothetical protein K432DRAFT_387383 [Lepidopterella palustris CBS 459.81]